MTLRLPYSPHVYIEIQLQFFISSYISTSHIMLRPLPGNLYVVRVNSYNITTIICIFLQQSKILIHHAEYLSTYVRLIIIQPQLALEVGFNLRVTVTQPSMQNELFHWVTDHCSLETKCQSCYSGKCMYNTPHFVMSRALLTRNWDKIV